MNRQLLAILAFTSVAATSFGLPTLIRADSCSGATNGITCQAPPRRRPNPSVVPATANHPSTIERYTFSYRLHSASPIVYVGTGYAPVNTHTVGQVVSMPALTRQVEAVITAVDDTIPFDLQRLGSPITVTQQYEMNLPQTIYGSAVHPTRPLLK